MANTIPTELTQLNNWVAYEIRPNPDNADKPKKEPINPHTGENARSNNANTWGDYQTAINRAQMISKGGIGFMFGEPGRPSGIAGIDLDDCFDGDDEGHVFLMPEAAEIVNLMDSYTEYSPSGQGLHILFKLGLSLHEIRPDINTGKKNDKLGIEIYDSGRYFTVTGKVYGAEKPIAERTEQAEEILRKYFPVESQVEAIPSPVKAPVTDSELWQKMFNAQNGFAIRKLYNGDFSGYESQSQADQALCNHLAYWTNNDANRIDQMFRQSGLYREKWERADYRNKTIANAIAATPEYIPNAPTVSVNSQQQKAKSDSEADSQHQTLPIIFDSHYLRKYFANDILNFQKYSNRKTGFSKLDSGLTLYPGLYVVGAISSLGKTTFCLQLSDQLAQAGEHVLYFAFEQTRFELVSKSLARLIQPKNSLIASYPTATQIRLGNATEGLLLDAIKEYDSKIGRRKAVIECDFETDIDAVKHTVEAYIKQCGVKPVVFIDYLQLIRADNPRLTNTKDIVDNNIRALKLLQMRNELVMFVVSSLNRQNYLIPIDFESFKESGAIEYTADVIIGLQLEIISTDAFSKLKTDTAKREAVKAAKRQSPREIQLCILKNRYGKSNENFYFHYYPKYDLFSETEQENMNHGYNGYEIDSMPR